MGQDLKGRELGVGIAQRKDGRYTARFVDNRSISKNFKSVVDGWQKQRI